MPKLPLSFDETDFQRQPTRDGVQVWFTPQGDGLGLFYFPIPPDIEADIQAVDSVRAYYRRLVNQPGSTVGIIEVDTLTIDGCRAVRTVLKAPQQPAGRTYIGSLTFPFRDFSFVLKVQCAERGMTGLRETMVLNRLTGSGETAIDPDSGTPIGWLDDPYDPAENGPMTRNRSERPEYDADFPDHPLSRARQILSHLEQSVTLDPNVKRQPAFAWKAGRS